MKACAWILSPHIRKKLAWLSVHTCKLRTGKSEVGDPWGSLVSQLGQIRGVPDLGRDPDTKNKVECDWGRHRIVSSDFHMHRHVHLHLHIPEHVHMPNNSHRIHL